VILALRALGIGDLATGVPALRALRAAYPGDALALAAPEWLRPLVDLIGGVDRLIPLSGVHRLPETHDWPGDHPALAVNLHGRGPESHRLLRTARPGRLMAFACPAAGHVDGPLWTADEHEVHRWCRLLRWYGVAADPDDLALPQPAPDGLPVGVTVVHPGAKATDRRWPPDRFAAVARALVARGHRVVVTGTSAERAVARAVAAAAALPEEAVLAGRTDAAALATLVAHARLVVCGDTGTGHLATAFGTPSVVLFGPVPPSLWGPPRGRPQHRALWTDVHAAPGVPPEGPHPALAALTVADVLAAVADLDRIGAEGR
jgi:ADP-heptose:LPS heptosyltransferase